jgi:hypothetical protein
MGADDVGLQLREIELHIDIVPCGAETVETALGDLFGDENSCHRDHRYRRRGGLRSPLNNSFTDRALPRLLGFAVVGPRSADVERWFIRRGVPHFIDDYAATTDIWTRSLPLLLVAYVARGFNALDIYEWSWQRNVVAGFAVIVVLVVGWALTDLVRGRPPFRPPDVLGTPELAAFILGPAVPSALFGQWGDAVQSMIEGAAVLAVIYLVTSYAVFAMLGWALRRSAAQLATLSRLVVRALPLLLLFTTFLFINAEVWQVAGTLVGAPYIATLTIFFLLGAVFVLSRVPALMRGMATFDDWSEVATLVADTPAAALNGPSSGAVPNLPLTVRQKLNVGLVTVFSQALQITFVALLLTSFFVLFGFLAIPESTAEGWTTLDQVHVIGTWRISGRDLVVTEPLLRVSGFLGAFTGMYFTVVQSTDATYRDEFAEDVAPQIREALAVRLAYKAHRVASTSS